MVADAPFTARFEMPQEAITRFGSLLGARLPELDHKPGAHHTDPDVARSVGLRAPVAYSLHYYGCVSDIMVRAFGRRWIEGGEMSMAFIRPVCAGDEVLVEVGGRPLQSSPAGQGDDRLVLQADVRNQHGELVAAGWASVGA